MYFFLNSYPLLQVTEESETSRADAMLVDAPNKVQAEHVRSTPVTSDLDPSSHKVKFQINDFVAAVYANSWYIGKIVGYMRDEDNDLFYNIDFMKTTSTIPPKFCWPDRKDELPVPYEDILMVIPSPSLTGTSRRQMYHTLEENILVSVEEKFQNRGQCMKYYLHHASSQQSSQCIDTIGTQCVQCFICIQMQIVF